MALDPTVGAGAKTGGTARFGWLEVGRKKKTLSNGRFE